MSAGCRLDDPGPFAEPWEAQVFALVVALQERGLFTQGDWARALGRTIRPHGEPEAAADYGRWLATLETLLAERGVADPSSLQARSDAFLRAAAATPHGEAILLANDPRPSS
ncbi:nitrile hydratase accessory protein [Methylobacterium sp. 77]|uniref:nitrile hydratase accessory protein n=1 Tax=Methylobacterium sp. 77 TaxID=1101192 RepID=UPI000378F713|nr:nitrile hydratase accessory protein [Methylobacterium sp. 77]